MTAARKRLVIELIATGIASPVFLLLMILARVYKVIAFLTMLVQPIGQLLGDGLNRLFPPQNGAWFCTMGNVLLADVLLELILIWILLMIAVKMLQRFVSNKRTV
jgi:hypothetical protein